MATDYKKFKTPFYKIQVLDAKGKRKVTLPHHILRLVDRVEIVEAWQGAGGTSFSNINVRILEGSREPASPDATRGTKGLYKMSTDGKGIDMDVAGSLTNRTGIIPDLRFSGSGGITFLTESERIRGSIDTRVQKNVAGKSVTRSHPKEDKDPMFLFQPRNILRITWGYLEDRKTHRTVEGYIASLRTNFPENSSPVTEITALPLGAFVDQIAPVKAVEFGKKQAAEKASLEIVTNATTREILDDIASTMGMTLVASNSLTGDKLEAHRQRVWVVGQSLQEFLHRLAKDSNAVLELKTIEGKPYLVFITKKEFETRVRISDKRLLTYKAPGSILKNFNITADFTTIVRNSQVGLDKSAERTSITNESGTDTAVIFKVPGGKNKKEEMVDVDPQGQNSIPACKKLVNGKMDGQFCGKAKNSPGNSEVDDDEKSKNFADQMMRKAISAEFTTIGYTQIVPGVIEINGIGVRYSGKYRILQASHIIESGNYITRCTAHTFTVPTGGVKWDGPEKGQEPEQTEKVGLFSTAAVDTLDKLQGTGKV